MQKFKLKYKLNMEAGDFTKDDIKDDNTGLCDSIAVISIIYPPDGSYSQLTLSQNGMTEEELTQDDLFKAWHMLGMQLRRNNALKNWKKQMVDLVGEMAQETMSSNKK